MGLLQAPRESCDPPIVDSLTLVNWARISKVGVMSASCRRQRRTRSIRAMNLARPLVAILLVPLIVACAAPEVHKKQAEAATDSDIERWVETWSHGDDTLDVVAQVPSGPGTHPLVVYFPGLGESVSAGAIWRDAWTRSGYAVVSIQARGDGPDTWRTEAARAGQFASIARQKFSADARQTRRRHSEYALGRLTQEANGDSRFRRVDSSRVALAGYELGAQTVASLWADSAVLPQSLKAAILLGPYADPLTSSRDARLARLDSRALVVNGTLHEDLYGISPRADEAPVGAAWHMVLLGSAQALLSGGADAARDIVMPRSGDRVSPETSGSSRRGRGHGGHLRSNVIDGHVAEAVDHGSHDFHGEPAPAAAAGQERGGFSSNLRQRQISAVRGVTIAFLDETVKGEEVARQWLAHFGKSSFRDVATLRKPRGP